MNFLLLLALSLTIAFNGCRESTEPRPANQAIASDSSAPNTQASVPIGFGVYSKPSIRYRQVVLADSSSYRAIKTDYSFDTDSLAHRVFTLLNRKELRFVRKGDTVVVPDSLSRSMLDYSVFPHYYPEAATVPKLVVISNPWQAYACYDSGRLVRFAAVNTGTRRKPTFPGRYAMNWRQRLRRSSLDSTWILPYTINFHLHAGSAFHQFEMPGRAASHSCVRQFMSDAQWLYSWGKMASLDSNNRYIEMTGTPVIILGMPVYSRKRSGPWTDIRDNATYVTDLPSNPLEVEEALIPISQIPKDARGGLSNRKRYLYAEDTLLARGIIDTTVRLSESIDFNKLRRERKRLRELREQQKGQSQQAIQKAQADSGRSAQ